MVVKVFVKEDKALCEWDVERFSGQDDLFRVSGSCSDYNHLVNFIKGSVLCALGQWNTVPDKVEFEIIRT